MSTLHRDSVNIPCDLVAFKCPEAEGICVARRSCCVEVRGGKVVVVGVDNVFDGICGCGYACVVG